MLVGVAPITLARDRLLRYPALVARQTVELRLFGRACPQMQDGEVAGRAKEKRYEQRGQDLKIRNTAVCGSLTRPSGAPTIVSHMQISQSAAMSFLVEDD